MTSSCRVTMCEQICRKPWHKHRLSRHFVAPHLSVKNCQIVPVELGSAAAGADILDEFLTGVELHRVPAPERGGDLGAGVVGPIGNIEDIPPIAAFLPHPVDKSPRFPVSLPILHGQVNPAANGHLDPSLNLIPGGNRPT